MTTTLTERYIAATVRSLPPQSQGDVRAELEASIGDDIDARIEHGEDRATAEHAVLTALGDPDALAAGYAERPLRLIGPRYYLTWWRLLKLLMLIVPLCAVGGVVIAKLIAGATTGDVIGTSAVVALQSIVHVGFWTTLVFWFIDRSGVEAGPEWSLDDLPELQDIGKGRGELIGSLVFLGLTVGAVLWDHFIGFVFVPGAGGQPEVVPLLHPELWPGWIAGLFVLIALEALLALAVYARRGWNSTLAAVNTVLALAFSVPAIVLVATGALINAAAFELVIPNADSAAEVTRILVIVVAVGIGVGGAFDIFDGWRKAYLTARQMGR